jgi:type I restriction enzyme M protein
LLDKQAKLKSDLKLAQEDLKEKLAAKYPQLTENEVKTLVIDDKWLATLTDVVQTNLDMISQTLASRIRQLAERYATTLSKLNDELSIFSERVNEHLKKMGK